MIDPDNLVAVARHLNANHEEAPPSAESRRRAVSTAYYALFHALLGEAAGRFVGANVTSAAFEIIYRGFDHGQMKRVLEAIDRDVLSAAYKERLRRSTVSQDIRDFAAVFVPLQELRHLADYKPLLDISQSDVADLIDEVASALQSLRRADVDEKADLLAMMLVKGR